MKDFNEIEKIITKIEKLDYKVHIGYNKLEVTKESEYLTPEITATYSPYDHKLITIDYTLPSIKITNRNKERVLSLIKKAEKMSTQVKKIWGTNTEI